MSTVLCGCGVGHSWSWKRADLDRNALNLRLHRSGPVAGAETIATEPDPLGDVSETGESGVRTATGTSRQGRGGDLLIVLRYGGRDDGPLRDHEEHWTCYAFTTDDGYDVDVERTRCPR